MDRTIGAASAVIHAVFAVILVAILWLLSTIEIINYPIIRDFAGMGFTFIILGILYCLYETACGIWHLVRPPEKKRNP